MVEHFPPIEREMIRTKGEDRNPAIQLFGRRFFIDQTIPELLIELLLVASSNKRIGNEEISSDYHLPKLEALRDWPEKVSLDYSPKARINLKLFAFLGASKLDTRHDTHRFHYLDLINSLKRPEKVVVSGTSNIEEVLSTLENLFLGFQGVGGQRSWCAQNFLPVIPHLISGESIWRKTKAQRQELDNWFEALQFFAHSQHLFLARGGELLYLQLCNAIRQTPEKIRNFNENADLSFSSQEYSPKELHEGLERAFSRVFAGCPATIGELAAFIDTHVDSETANTTDFDSKKSQRRYTKCGWCPKESWPEGLLFGVEIIRLCNAEIDPIEKIRLLEISCAFQVLRSLCAQSARHVEWCHNRISRAGPLGYVWAFSDPDGEQAVIKQISRRSVNTNQRMIFDALRIPEIREVVAKQKNHDEAKGRNWRDPYKEANQRYGYKLFLNIAKRIGLIVPRRGTGARFVLNDRLLRFLVMTVVRPGERVTYKTFKDLIFSHFGIALDDKRLGEACEWSGTRRLWTLGGDVDDWMIDMLDAAGFLMRLSDSCSLVKNPFGGEERKK